MLRWVKDKLLSHIGNRAALPNDDLDNMSARNQPSSQRNRRQEGQHDSSSQSPGPSIPNTFIAMRSALRKYEIDLRRENHRYRSLEGTKNRLQADNRMMKYEITGLKSDLSEFKGIQEDLYYIADQYIRPYAQKRGLRIRDDALPSYEAVLKPMLKDALQAHFLRTEFRSLQSDAEITQDKVQALEKHLADVQVSQSEVQSFQDQIQSLQSQVHTLQKQLLTNIDKVRVVSDDLFAKDFRSLVAMVKSLSRSVRVTKETNMLETLGSRGLLVGVQDRHWSTRARKKYFTEAWIWSVLIDMVFSTPFSIIGGDGAAIAELWSRLFGSAYHRGWPSPSALCESWRCTTVEQAVETVGKTNTPEQDLKLESGRLDGQMPLAIENEELRMRHHYNVAHEIGTMLASLSTAADFSLVPKIVEAAFALALQMSLQKSRLQITFPNVGDQFDCTQMTSIPDPNGEDLEIGNVAFIVRPGLTKWGDAHGKHFDQRYDIVPSHVHLEAGVEGVVIKAKPV